MLAFLILSNIEDDLHPVAWKAESDASHRAASSTSLRMTWGACLACRFRGWEQDFNGADAEHFQTSVALLRAATPFEGESSCHFLESSL